MEGKGAWIETTQTLTTAYQWDTAIDLLKDRGSSSPPFPGIWGLDPRQAQNCCLGR